MFGLLMIFIFIVGFLIVYIKNSSYSAKNRRDAINSKEKTYMDWQGNTRRVDNGHKVLYHVTDFKTGDKVDLDMKTNQILRNYSQEERDKEIRQETDRNYQNKMAREKARKEGLRFYTSEDLLPYEERRMHIIPTTYTTRRVRDNLLVKDLGWACADEKCGFILYVYSDLDKNVQEIKDRNKKRCKDVGIQNKTGMTEQELLEYAKSIGAIL